MEYTKQEFENELYALLFEYNKWLKLAKRTDIQIKFTRNEFSEKIRDLIGANIDIYQAGKNLIKGDFLIIDVIPDHIILGLNSFAYYRFSSKIIQKQAFKLNIGDIINIEGRPSGWITNDECDNIKSLLDNSHKFVYTYSLNNIENYKGKPLIVNLRDNRDAKGCYIATACYEHFEAPEVLILREFRDDVLTKYPLGRVFIKTYYFISPVLSKYISKSGFLKLTIKKIILNPLVFRIRKKQGQF